MDNQNGPDRRGVLGGLAGAALTAAYASSAKASNRLLIIEWNQHMFSQNMVKFPYHPKAAYKPDPAKNPADALIAYQKRLTEEGIDRAVIVQPEPYGDDHTLILDCLHRPSPDQYKGTSLFYPKALLHSVENTVKQFGRI